MAALERPPGEKPDDTPEFVNGVQIVKHDPIFGKLCEWELEVQRRRGKEFTRS
jgi:hypothetical protein